jgi:hypothetical protein
MADHRYVFVAGLHRSGTTLLTRALGNHPDVSSFAATGYPEDEGQFLQRVYPIGKIYGGPGRFGFDPRAHLTERSPLATDANRTRLRSEWEAHWDLSKGILVEKSPPNLLKMRFLQWMFPDAAFVVVMRHPIAVALATQKWSLTSTHSLIHHWLVCHERFLRDSASLRRPILTSYEALVADPTTLPRIQEAIGIRGQEGALEPRTGINDRYFRLWQESEGLLARPYRALLAGAFERRANRFGYSLTDPWRQAPPSAQVADLLARWAAPPPLPG